MVTSSTLLIFKHHFLRHRWDLFIDMFFVGISLFNRSPTFNKTKKRQPVNGGQRNTYLTGCLYAGCRESSRGAQTQGWQAGSSAQTDWPTNSGKHDAYKRTLFRWNSWKCSCRSIPFVWMRRFQWPLPRSYNPLLSSNFSTLILILSVSSTWSPADAWSVENRIGWSE